MQASSLQKIQGAESIDSEVCVRVARRPIVGGLRGGMNHDLYRGTEPVEQGFDPPGVPNIQIFVQVVLQGRLQAFFGPGGRGLGSEETRPHIVIDSDNIEAFVVKFCAGFGADQSC